jgi:hypothetical protein
VSEIEFRRCTSNTFTLESSVQEESFLLEDLPLKMGPIGSPETSMLNQPTLRNIPEDDEFNDLTKNDVHPEDGKCALSKHILSK